MMFQVLIDGPEQSKGEWAGFAILALLLACCPWIWRWSARRHGRHVEIRETVLPSLVFLAFAGLALFEAVTHQ